MNQRRQGDRRGQTSIMSISSGGNMQLGEEGGERERGVSVRSVAQVPSKAVKTHRGRVWRRTSGSGWDSQNRTVGAGGTGRSSGPRSGVAEVLTQVVLGGGVSWTAEH